MPSSRLPSPPTPELVVFAVKQEDTGAIAIEQVRGLADHQVQQGAEVPLGVHLPADGEQGGELLMQFRLHWPHGGFSLPHRVASVY